MTIQWWCALPVVALFSFTLTTAIIRACRRKETEQENRRLAGRPTLMGSDRGWFDRWDDHLAGREWDDPEGITGNSVINDFAASVEELEAARIAFRLARLEQSVKDFGEAVMSGRAVPAGARRRRKD